MHLLKEHVGIKSSMAIIRESILNIETIIVNLDLTTRGHEKMKSFAKKMQ